MLRTPSSFIRIALVAGGLLASACQTAPAQPSAPTAAPAAKPTEAPKPAAAATTQSAPAPTAQAAASGTPVKIGNLAPNTGVGAAFGDSQTSGVTLAVDEINAAGGVPGVGKLVTATEDTGSTATGAVNAANKLIQQEKVAAIIGEAMSANTLAVVPVTQKAQVPQVTTMSSAPTITEQGSKYIFRTQITAVRSGETLANYLNKDKGYKKIAILNDTNEFGTNFANVVEDTLKKNGAPPVMRATFATNDKDFTSQLLKVKESGADAVVLSGQFAEGALIVTQMKQLGLSLPTGAPDGLTPPKFIELAGDAANGVIFTNSFVAGVQDPKVQEFVKKYEARFNKKPDNGGALSYDSVYVVAKAMEKAKSADPQKIRDAIASLTYDGVTGKISYDEKGDSGLIPNVYGIQNKEYVLLKRT